MTISHRTLQMALDALYSGESPPNARQQDAIAALRKALAAPEPADQITSMDYGMFDEATNPPAPVPAGWVMVPREPTQKMERAGNDVGLMGMSSLGSGAVYRAMIAASPAAPLVPDLKHCACEFDGDTCITQCKLHAAHVDTIHEWAERAKAAEAKLPAAPVVRELQDDLIESVIRDVAELDYSSPEGMPDVMLVTADELRGILQAHGIGGGNG